MDFHLPLINCNRRQLNRILIDVLVTIRLVLDMSHVRISSCIVRQAREPVCIGGCYRYSLFQQANRLRPTDIRVSGVSAVQRSGRGVSNQHSTSCVKRRAKYGISAAYSHFLRDSKFLQHSVHCAKLHTLTMPETKPFERLPKVVIPKHYNLKLKPNLKTFVFEGEEAIKVEVRYWMLTCMECYCV